jgi:hypothetical protein
MLKLLTQPQDLFDMLSRSVRNPNKSKFIQDSDAPLKIETIRRVRKVESNE